MTIRDAVINQIHRVAKQQGRQLVPLNDDTPLLESGLDSLCLAILVASLDDELGLDPLMATATSARQREMGEIGKQAAVRKTLKEGRAAMLDAISAAAKDRH